MSNKYTPPGPSRRDFDVTTPNINLHEKKTPPVRPAHGAPSPQTPTATPPPAPPPSTLPARRVPFRFWLAGGIAVLLFIALLVTYWPPVDSGFTLVVRGAAPGSDIFVDNVRRGVTAADGTIRVPGLQVRTRNVRVTHEGYEPFHQSVSGNDGQEVPLSVSPVAKDAKQHLPSEIDYKGQMVLILAGKFTMGDDNHHPNEKPAHDVTLPDYYIDKFEVTNEQYKKFCDETRRKYPVNPWWAEEVLNTKDYFNSHRTSPVVDISWSDATAYAKWVGKKLPTEEEWEKAASWNPTTQKKRRWPWGDNPEPGYANLASKSGPTPVGQNASGASAYGVQDMAGNVLEWVSDYYRPYEGSNTSDPNFGTKNRVVRGGSFTFEFEDARTTCRIYYPPEFTAAQTAKRSRLIGFRCAVSVNDPKLQEHLRAQSR